MVLLATGLVTWNSPQEMVSGVSLRVGIVMAVWWLAYPQLSRVPPWYAAIAGVLFLLVLRWPRMLLLAVPVLVALWLLRPRGAARRER
ncbi:MAG: hypothetical protein DWQ37_18445 [Planctomycetota bacterium]|nr:MAG: hypothetical protein DWQ37_18445 [Planctomycetota bacterium]